MKRRRVDDENDPGRDLQPSSTRGKANDMEEEEEAAAEHMERNANAPSTDPSMWGADPLYWTHLILLNIHVTEGLIPNGSTWEQVNRERARLKCNHALPKTGRVVAHCQLVGTLVRKQSNSMFKTFTIDDGTALVDCVEWNNNEETEAKGFAIVDPPLGASVRCIGRLDWPSARFQSSFKNSVRRVVLTRPLLLVQNVNEELRHWHRAMELWEGLYGQPRTGGVSNPISGGIPSKPTSTYGGPVEDLVMHIVRNDRIMPLISSMNESTIRERYAPFLRICFEFGSLLRTEELMTLLLKQAPSESGSPETILRLALKRLCFAGQVFVMDTRLELYAVITHEDFLAPAILRALIRFKTAFVPHKVLLEKLREDPRLHTVSRERFDSSLSPLMLESFIIEGEPGTFSLFSRE